MEIKKKRESYCFVREKRSNSGQEEKLTADCKTGRNSLKGWDPYWCASFPFVRGLDKSGKKITRNYALGNRAIRKTGSRLSMKPSITKIKKPHEDPERISWVSCFGENLWCLSMQNTQNSSQKYKICLNIYLRAQCIRRKYQACGGATEQN